MYGVPKASALGPLLFILYTNDNVECLGKAKGIFYADASTIYYTHTQCTPDFIKSIYDDDGDDIKLTSTPKGSYNAKTGVNWPMSLNSE